MWNKMFSRDVFKIYISFCGFGAVIFVPTKGVTKGPLVALHNGGSFKIMMAESMTNKNLLQQSWTNIRHQHRSDHLRLAVFLLPLGNSTATR